MATVELIWDSGNGYFSNGTTTRISTATVGDLTSKYAPTDLIPNPPAGYGIPEDYVFGGWRNLPTYVPASGGEYTAYYNKVGHYEVTLIVDGSVYDTIYATAGTTTSLPSLSSSAGKEFKGWYTSSSGGSKVTSVNLAAGKTATYYAQFDLGVCEVSFEYRNSSSSWTTVGPYLHQYGSTITTAPITPPKILGYKHTGWNPSLPYTVDDAQVLISATYDAVAVYNVTFSVNGTVVKSEKVNKGDSATPPSLSEFEYLIPEGSSFEGWDKDYTNVQGYLAVTAKLSSNYHTVTYYYLTESGNSTSATQSVKHGDSPSGLTPSIPTGYEFNGWYTSPTGGNKVNLAEQKITSDTFYYAQYSIITYTITWDADEGLFSNNRAYKTSTVPYGNLIANYEPDEPTLSNHIFSYWENKDTGEPLGNERAYSDASYVAKYTKNSYKVTFKYYDSSNTYISYTPDTKVEHGATALSLAPDADQRPGYSFTGWSPSIYAGITDDTTFTAQYTPVVSTTEYKVEHYLQKTDGTYPTTASESQTLSGTIGDTIKDKQKTYTHFVYDATKSSATSSGTIKEDGSLVLKYYYTRNKYTVKFMNEGKEYEVQSVYYEAIPTKPKVDPTKEAKTDGTAVYLFEKWDPVLSAVTSKDGATYTAKYIEVPQFVWTCGGVDDEENLINGPNKVAGLRIYVTADEWNSLVNFINKSGVTLESASVNKGDKISASIVNLVATAVQVENVTQKTRITAAFFNLLREKANALRLAFEKSKKE